MIEPFILIMFLVGFALGIGIFFSIVIAALRLAWRYSPYIILIAVLYMIITGVLL
jgi:hypothetical protein